ncbi:MAG TPA: ABC transporter substrate-binding protein [Cellulomonas sp.]
MTVARLLLGYYHPWPNDAGFTLARHQGRYAEAGIDLHVGVVDPGRGDTLAHLARDEGDLGVVPTNRLLAARSRGQRVTAVAAVNQVGLETLHSLRSLGIARPRDLTGRRVALNSTPRGLAMVRHLVQADGGDPDQVTIVDSGPRELQSADLLAGTAEAYFGAYWAWDELFDPHPAADRLSWPVKDHGAPAFHSYLLVAREDWLAAHPGTLGPLLAASAAGFHAAAADPVAAGAHFGHVTPYFPPAVLERSVRLVAPTWFHAGRWGTLRDDLVAPYARWLLAHDALPDLAGLAGAGAGPLATGLAGSGGSDGLDGFDGLGGAAEVGA